MNSKKNDNKRKRIVSYQMAKKACFHCKKSHRKCNDERPCQNCVKSNKNCYDVENKYRKNVVAPTFTPGGVEAPTNNNNNNNIITPKNNSSPTIPPLSKPSNLENNIAKKTQPNTMIYITPQDSSNRSFPLTNNKQLNSYPTNNILLNGNSITSNKGKIPHSISGNNKNQLGNSIVGESNEEANEKFQTLINILMHASHEIDSIETDGPNNENENCEENNLHLLGNVIQNSHHNSRLNNSNLHPNHPIPLSHLLHNNNSVSHRNNLIHLNNNGLSNNNNNNGYLTQNNNNNYNNHSITGHNRQQDNNKNINYQMSTHGKSINIPPLKLINNNTSNTNISSKFLSPQSFHSDPNRSPKPKENISGEDNNSISPMDSPPHYREPIMMNGNIPPMNANSDDILPPMKKLKNESLY
eukprot:TRINITY_DN2181_c0_g1_i2.p1 TRINITY_DN2181_c0_g1~~TRINITY_DN2181_c0_g1_i2.p1  ORF type:complete len:412 (+),score=94.05 TRINITY_DN2181_c0_g1_i2:177-1412(+)